MRRWISLFAVLVNAITGVFADECDWCGTLSLGETGFTTPTSRILTWSQGEAETNRIDLLFAFDISARRWLAENSVTPEVFSMNVLEQMNTSLALTGLDECFLFRLVAMFDVQADLSSYDVLRLCKYASGKTESNLENAFVPLRNYRNDVSADIVVVFEVPQDTKYHGATLPLDAEALSKANIASYAEYAYSIVDVRTAFSPYWTALHEVGHVFGAGHSDTQKSSPGPQLKPYSSAFHFDVGERFYTTVMGYVARNDNGEVVVERLPFFSSPDWAFNGVAVGTAAKNDNTRTLRETYPLVANFRVATFIPGWGIGKSGQEDTIAVSVKDGLGSLITNGTTVAVHQFENVEWSISAQAVEDVRTTIKVKGLPTGLKYSSKTGLVSGCAKKIGTFQVNVTATARGVKSAEMGFALTVAQIPASLVGSYVGIVSNAMDGAMLVSATISSSGKVSVKMRYLGANRTFSCTCFDSVKEDGAIFIATARKNIGGKSYMLPLRVSGRAISIDGYDGLLRQNPWGRKDVTAPLFRKNVKTSINGFDFIFSGKGKARVIGKVNGKKVSGLFQVLAEENGGYVLPVFFSPKKKISGWSGLFMVEFVCDKSGQVVASAVRLCEKSE